MKSRLPVRLRGSQHGMVLVSSLLLLVVVTIIALSMYRSLGIQEKIAGNVREKQRALQAAESAETFAETWLWQNAVGTASVVCASTAPALNANLGQMQICSNALPLNVPGGDVTVPWTIGGGPVGITYTPPGMTTVSSSTYAAADVTNPPYYALPSFYISDMGPSADQTNYPGEIYQIDAMGYGGTSLTVAEVESTYVVYTTSHSID